jgi:hypothetical protein
LPLSSFIDITDKENLQWLAILGSSVILSLASSIIPNFVETTLDMRSHNRSRLFNETAARLNIIYVTFLLALIFSDDFDRTGTTVTWLVAIGITIVLMLFASFIVSGKTMQSIHKLKDWKGNKHECQLIDGVCDTPIGIWMYCKVCFLNGFMALIVGLFCVGLAASPTIIKHNQLLSGQSSPPQGEPKDYFDAFKRIYKQTALQTRDEFKKVVLGANADDLEADNLNVSYWFSYNGTLYQLGTTHEESAEDKYSINGESIIGCAYANQNSSVSWDDISKKAAVWPYNQEFSRVGSCQYATLQTVKLKSIICATYNGSSSKNPEDAVGICVFSKDQGKISVNHYHEFLREKTEIFYNAISPLIKKKILIPQ